MGISIVVTSGKGGVGKTTTTANLGTALAALGKKVVVVDGDTGLRNLDVLMGLENRIVYTIIDVIENRCRLKQALIKDKRYANLCLLPTAQTKDKDDIRAQDMFDLVNKLKEEFDYVLIDSPAGIIHSSQSQLPPGNYCFPEMCPLGSSGLRLYPSLSSGPCTHSTPLPGDTDAVPCLLPVFLRTGHPVWFFIPLCTSPESLVHSESLESGRNLPLCLE